MGNIAIQFRQRKTTAVEFLTEHVLKREPQKYAQHLKSSAVVATGARLPTKHNVGAIVKAAPRFQPTASPAGNNKANNTITGPVSKLAVPAAVGANHDPTPNLIHPPKAAPPARATGSQDLPIRSIRNTNWAMSGYNSVAVNPVSDATYARAVRKELAWARGTDISDSESG